MKNTGYEDGPKKIAQILDFGAPNYYAEFVPRASAMLNSHGSLCRITGFLCAASRVKTIQSISEINFKQNLLYLDNNCLLLKNLCLKQYITNMHQDMPIEKLGKWRLITETIMGRNDIAASQAI